MFKKFIVPKAFLIDPFENMTFEEIGLYNAISTGWSKTRGDLYEISLDSTETTDRIIESLITKSIAKDIEQ